MQTSSVSDSSSLYAQYAQQSSCKPCDAPRQKRQDDDDGEGKGRVARSGGGERLIDAVFQALSQLGLGGSKPTGSTDVTPSPSGDETHVRGHHHHHHHHHHHGMPSSTDGGSEGTSTTNGPTTTTGSGSNTATDSTSGTPANPGNASTSTTGTGSSTGTGSTSATGSTSGTGSTSSTGSTSGSGSTSGTGSTTGSSSTSATSPMNLITALGSFMHDLFSILQGQGGDAPPYGRAHGYHHHHRDGGGFSGIASNLQKLIQELTAAEKGGTQGAAGADASGTSKPSPLDTLQKDFKALVVAMGGDPEKASLKDFLLAFAQNLSGNSSTAGNLIQTTA